MRQTALINLILRKLIGLLELGLVVAGGKQSFEVYR
jgi:hypothetical protein